MRFTIARLMPGNSSGFLYRIKGDIETHERMAPEAHLEALFSLNAGEWEFFIIDAPLWRATIFGVSRKEASMAAMPNMAPERPAPAPAQTPVPEAAPPVFGPQKKAQQFK